MIVELILGNAGQTQDEDKPYFPRPSSVGSCPRKLFYHATGVPPTPLPARALLVFRDGHWHEELIKDEVRKTVYELLDMKGEKQRIDIAKIGDFTMTGEIDGIFISPLGAKRLLSIKSMNHFSFQRLPELPWDHLTDWNEASKDHYALNNACRQDNLYLHGFKQAGFGADIDEVLIIIKNKNTAAMTEFLIAYNEDQALADIEFFRDIDRRVKSGDIPPRPYDYDAWQCGYCRWQDHCWEGYAGEVAALSKDVALSEEIETAARYYNELGAQKAEIEREREGIGKTLRQALSAAQAQSARAGEYLLTLSVGHRTKIDETLVPPEAIKKVPSERFTVKRIKPKEARA